MGAPSHLPASKAPRHRRALIALGVALLLAAGAGYSLGRFMRLDLPDVRALQDYRPPVTTRVIAGDGSLLATFAEQRRMLIGYADIPQLFQQALLATEDANYYAHTGIDMKGIARAAWRDLRSLRLAQGASTLTQQLARNLFLHPKKTIRRKLQEALLALEIERQYTKQEILAFYCNQIYMGHGRYGLEAAARNYFNTPARDLNLAQAATLAGLIQRPEALSPLRHPDRALERRNYVLERMVEVGFISPEEARATQQTPLEVKQGAPRHDLAPYFVEEVRRWLQDRHGTSSLYKGGMVARSTLDPRLQEVANAAVKSGLRELDKRKGWRGAPGRVPEGEDPASWVAPDWSDDPEIGEVHDGVVLSVNDTTALVRVGPYLGRLGREEIAWTRKTKPSDLLAAGDLVRVRLVAGGEDGEARIGLEQEPDVQGALVAIEPSTGAIRALVGGYDFATSEFNRVMQAKRQTGSAFKPFVYAAALASGWTLADTLLDEPTVFLDPRNPQPYQPENYTNKYYGRITLRTALEKSANIATVKLLDEIGYRPVIDTAKALGIRSDLRAYPSLALGAFETTLLQLTTAYGTFANQGVLVEPHFLEQVSDREGAVVDRIEPTVYQAVSPQVAYMMNQLLAGVISDGTGRAAKHIGLHLAGKTGTTDDYTDAWFIGYAPSLAVGVWVGFDEPQSLGRRETGARAALPIWRAFMENAGLPDEPFPEPMGLTLVDIDRRTGRKANPDAYCHPVFKEVFRSSTEPTASCSVYDHQHLRLPYALQRFPLDERGVLQVPAEELDGVLVGDPSIRLVDGGRRIEVHEIEETISFPIRVVPGRDPYGRPAPAVDPRLGPFDLAEWVGKDGRPAQIVWLDGRSPRPVLR